MWVAQGAGVQLLTTPVRRRRLLWKVRAPRGVDMDRPAASAEFLNCAAFIAASKLDPELDQHPALPGVSSGNAAFNKSTGFVSDDLYGIYLVRPAGGTVTLTVIYTSALLARASSK